MAKPRVFVSSTYFDLKSVRADVERFIRERGYEPVLNERGHITYGKEEALEAYCYKEIETCDILVSIIGGRYGSSSNNGEHSISQMELKKALQEGKQVYVFIDRDVYAEHRTYLKNKGSKLKWSAVDNESIYDFISEIYALPRNNQICAFETSQDIINNLREQWSGLFQDLLRQRASDQQISMLREITQGVDTVRSLVKYLTDQKEKGDKTIEVILLTDHPLFHRLQKLLNVKYRLYFTNISELETWLEARSYKAVSETEWDDADVMEWLWTSSSSGNTYLLKISRSIFDSEGKLRVIETSEWKDEWVTRNLFKSSEEEAASTAA